jgi:tetratricopeptide (TPR) repeat protein
MIKNRIYILFISLLVIALSSCKPAKTISKSKQKQEIKDNSSVYIDATKENLLGNYDEAAVLFKKALELNPTDDGAMYELARIYTRKNNVEEALKYVSDAVAIDDQNVFYLLLNARLLQSVEEYQLAAELFEKVVLLKPNYTEYYNKLAVAYLYAGKPMEAVEVYNRLEEKIGVTEEFSMKKQNIYVQLNKVNKAVEELEKLIENYPGEAKYYAVLAELCLNNDMDEKAQWAYQKIIEIDPGNPYIHVSLADYYKKKGEEEKAFEELKKGFRNPSLDIDTKIQILIQYYTVNEIYDNYKEQAFALSEILVEVHPGDPKAYSMYGDFLYQSEKYKEALAAFQQVIKLDSSKYLVWEQLLFTQSKLDSNNALLADSKRAIALFPEQPLPYLFAGGALYMNKDWEACIKILNQGLYFVVNNVMMKAQFYAYLGDAYNQTGNNQKSDEAYDNVLALTPDNDYVLNNYAYYLSLRNEKLEKAAKMAKRATELKPNSSSNQDTYGWVLYKMGYYEEAKFWIEKAMENGAEESPVILEHYGDVLWQLGQKEEAVNWWKKAQNAGKGSDFLDQKVREQKLIE